MAIPKIQKEHFEDIVGKTLKTPRDYLPYKAQRVINALYRTHGNLAAGMSRQTALSNLKRVIAMGKSANIKFKYQPSHGRGLKTMINNKIEEIKNTGDGASLTEPQKRRQTAIKNINLHRRAEEIAQEDRLAEHNPDAQTEALSRTATVFGQRSATARTSAAGNARRATASVFQKTDPADNSKNESSDPPPDMFIGGID